MSAKMGGRGEPW